MAKTISVSSDDSTYLTLSGNTGEFSESMDSADDTVYGQNFKSMQPSLLSWTASGNAYYKGFSGYAAKILKPGTSTSFSSEAVTLLSTNLYQITNSAKRVLDRSVAIVVRDGTTPIGASDIEYIDYLFGKVKLVGSYTPSGTITFYSGNYLPMVAVGTAKSFTLTQTADTIDTTSFSVAQGNGGYKTYNQGLQTVTLALSGFYSSSNAFHTAVVNRSELIIEINPDGAGGSTARGFFKPGTRSQNGDVGAIEEESMDFNLSVPVQSKLSTAFTWNHSGSTTLSTATQLVLSSWLTQTGIYVKYLHDGTNGFKGSAVVTDVSLESSVDGMNIFSANFQGSGAPTVVP